MKRRGFLKLIRLIAMIMATMALPAAARANAYIIHIDAANCSTCGAFNQNGLSALQSTAAAHGYGVKRVNVRSFQDLREDAARPQSLKAIRDQMQSTGGAPRFLVVYHGKVYRDFLGGDDAFAYFAR